MRAPLSWLRDFAPFGADVTELTAALNGLGLVVEGIRPVGQGLDGVVVARVHEIRPIEGADRIRSVLVGAGEEPVEVVCGAWNFSVGDLVPLATVGTVLPGADFAIARRKMRGAVSNGMLCSGAELGLSEDAAGIMILPAGLEPGAPFAEAMGIVPDVVFDLDITPNRPDALSMGGVARDLAAALRLPFALPERPGPGESRPAAPAVSPSPPPAYVTVATGDAELCPVFCAQALSGVSVGPSPAWVARRLTLAGMRSINSVVDASNYVMLELGQPTHPYDLAKVEGRHLRARPARPGERVTTLDGIERELGTGRWPDCVIVDGRDRAIGIAGIMGGQSSQISEATVEVMIEAAYFDPMAIARTARRLGLRSEASVRFERGCDPEAALVAAERVCALVRESAGGAVGEPVQAGSPPPRARVRLRTERVNRLLGTRLDAASVSDHLSRIGFAPQPEGAGIFSVEVPGWRPDVRSEIDLVEEVARHHGYQNIERAVPTTTQVGGLTTFQRQRRRIREVMVGAGLSEVWTPSLLAPEDHLAADLVDSAEAAVDGGGLELDNPMSRDESVLRRSMLPGLLRVIRFNLARRNENIRVFEVGRVFSPGLPLPVESERLCAALAGADAPAAVVLWRTVVQAMRLDDPGIRPAVLAGLHPSRTGQVLAADRILGTVGEVDPAVVAAFGLEGRIGWLELDLQALQDAPRRPPQVQPVSVYPSADVDLAFVLEDSVAAQEIERTLREAGAPHLVGLRLFDVFRDSDLIGPGRRSLAWRLRFCAPDHTLTDAEVAAARARCVAAVESAHPARLRS